MTRSLRFVSIALVSLTAVALCTAALAQPGGGGPGFGGRMGAIGAVEYTRAINMPTVQKELNLTDDQKAKIKETVEKAATARRELMSEMRDLSQEERQAKMPEVQKKMQAQTEETKKAIEGILQPKQLQRLKGIALQVAGTRAINDKDVQKELKLSKEQIAKIVKIGDDSMKKMRELFAEGGDRETMGPKLQEMNKDVEKQLLDVLTDSQKASFEKMKGDKLDIPADELRGPGRGGR